MKTWIIEIPIRHISFTTPPDRRTALIVDAKGLYSEFLGARMAVLEYDPAIMALSDIS